MQTLILDSGVKLRYYYHLDEFPAVRRSYFTRYLIESSELPKTPEEFSERIVSLLTLNLEGKRDEVATGLQNLMFGFNAIHQTYGPDELAFGSILHDVDGVLVADLSPDGLRDLVRPLSIPVGTIARVVDEVKKNFRRSEAGTTPVSLGIYN